MHAIRFCHVKCPVIYMSSTIRKVKALYIKKRKRKMKAYYTRKKKLPIVCVMNG